MDKKDQVTEEMEVLAKSMAQKATETHELLVDILADMDSDEIKKSAETMTNEELSALKKGLESLKLRKAAKKPESAATDKDPKMKTPKITDTVIEEDETSDDADEKLVEDKNKDVKHQGDNSPEGIEGELIKAESDSEKVDQPEKQVKWKADNHLLKSNSGGRNHSFSVNEYYKQALELKKSQENSQDELKKSEKVDINYIIEKGLDLSSDQIEALKKAEANKKAEVGAKIKTFNDAEIAKSMGLSTEDIKKVFG